MTRFFNIKILAIILSLNVFATSSYADIQINEVMQSNIDCIMDDLNEYPDSWVELYNNSDSDITLSNYAISIQEDYSEAYRLPSISVKPKEYVIVYCDKTDHEEFPEALMHTPFRLDSGKGTLYLWKDNNLLETLILKKMPAPNIAYGRLTENGDKWGYQAHPTPGTENCGKLHDTLLSEPIFSKNSCTLTENIALELSLPEDAPAGTIIRYTLDGTAPNSESAIYSAPILIDKSMAVRAVLMNEEYMSPLPTTHSFISHPLKHTLPIVSLVTDRANMYDDNIGILVTGKDADHPNYFHDWRRPANVEFLMPDGSVPINQVIETRVKGLSSRHNAVKSMVLYANKRFGTKRLQHEFFPDQRPGINNFKSLELRNAGNDFAELYMRDALSQSIAADGTNVDFQAYRPVVLYINGEYVGLINLRERGNEDNIYTNYDELEDIALVENWGSEFKTGDKQLFEDFRKFYSSSRTPSYEEFNAIMDVPEFFDAFSANLIANNWDYPFNNNIMWRPMEEGGKWRWILKDMDDGFGIWSIGYDFEYLRYMYDTSYKPSKGAVGNNPVGTLLFRKLMEVEEARDLFIDRLMVSLGSNWHPSYVFKKLDCYAEALREEIELHRDKYPSYTTFQQKINFIKRWYPQRHEFLYSHVADHFQLNSLVNLNILQEGENKTTLSVNDMKLATEEFNGKYPSGHIIKVSADIASGQSEVKGWRVSIIQGINQLDVIYPNTHLIMPMPCADEIIIVPVTDLSGIDGVISECEPKVAEWFDLQGRPLGTKCPKIHGIYLRKTGTSVSKVIL